MKVGDETKEVCTALCWADGQEIIERDVRRLDIVSLSRQVDLLSFFLSFLLSLLYHYLVVRDIDQWRRLKIKKKKKKKNSRPATFFSVRVDSEKRVWKRIEYLLQQCRVFIVAQPIPSRPHASAATSIGTAGALLPINGGEIRAETRKRRTVCFAFSSFLSSGSFWNSKWGSHRANNNNNNRVFRISFNPLFIQVRVSIIPHLLNGQTFLHSRI